MMGIELAIPTIYSCRARAWSTNPRLPRLRLRIFDNISRSGCNVCGSWWFLSLSPSLLQEAKELVESAPKPLKESLPTAEADELKKKLEAIGAKIELV